MSAVVHVATDVGVSIVEISVAASIDGDAVAVGVVAVLSSVWIVWPVLVALIPMLRGKSVAASDA